MPWIQEYLEDVLFDPVYKWTWSIFMWGFDFPASLEFLNCLEFEEDAGTVLYLPKLFIPWSLSLSSGLEVIGLNTCTLYCGSSQISFFALCTSSGIDRFVCVHNSTVVGGSGFFLHSNMWQYQDLIGEAKGWGLSQCEVRLMAWEAALLEEPHLIRFYHVVKMQNPGMFTSLHQDGFDCYRHSVPYSIAATSSASTSKAWIALDCNKCLGSSCY